MQASYRRLLLVLATAAATLHCNGSVDVLSAREDGTTPDATAPEAGVSVDGGAETPRAPLVLPQPAPYPGTKAGACYRETRIDFSMPGCGNGCVVAATPGAPLAKLFDNSAFTYSLFRITGASDTRVFVSTYASTSHPNVSLLAFPLAGGAGSVVDPLGGSTGGVDTALATPQGFFYVMDADGSVSLRRVTPNGTQATRLLEGLPPEAGRSNLIVAGGYVYLGHLKGVVRVPLAGGPSEPVFTRTSLRIPGMGISGKLPMALDGDTLFVSTVDDDGKARIWRQPTSGGTPVAIYAVDESTAETPTALAFDGARQKVLALTKQKLVEMDALGGAVVTYALGAAFPQFGGTLLPEHLEVADGKVYFEEVCNDDADVPAYGPRVFEPATANLAWRDAEPNFPIIPYLARREGGEPVVVGPRAITMNFTP